MQFFHDLGWLAEQRWREKNYDETVFPEIAAQALAEMDPNKNVSPWDIVRWVHTNTQLPRQQDIDASFGNPPVTLYAGPRFHIDVYFWLDGTTTIHQHAFCGAFQVLLGSSIHSQYKFRQEQQINAHFAIGGISLDSVQLLREGDVRQILPGDKYIHSLFHLDRPSATVTIRTYQSPSGYPQFNYLKPCVAVDPFFKEQSTIKKVQTVALLLSMKHPEADTFIGDLISASDLHTTFLILKTAFIYLTGDELERVFDLTTGKERFHGLIEQARRRHGQLADRVAPVFEEFQRQAKLVNYRAYLTSSEHRFFLALLLNVPDRTIILDLVKRRFPDSDPVSIIAGWVKEFSITKMLGSPEPNILGIDYFDEDSLFVLRCLLKGLSIRQVKSEIEKEYPADCAGNLKGELEEILNSFQNSMPIESLISSAGMRGGADNPAQARPGHTSSQGS